MRTDLMEYQLSYFETVDEFRRGQPDSKFLEIGLPAAMTTAGAAIKSGNIKIVKIVDYDESFSLVVFAGKIKTK
jgi:hypothetical protein